MDDISWNLEPEYFPTLLKVLSLELEGAYARPMVSKGQKLMGWSMNASVEGETTTFQLHGPKHPFQLRMTVPVFDPDIGFSTIQCSCMEQWDGLADQRCPHMWAAQAKLLARLQTMQTSHVATTIDALLAELGSYKEKAPAAEWVLTDDWVLKFRGQPLKLPWSECFGILELLARSGLGCAPSGKPLQWRMGRLSLRLSQVEDRMLVRAGLGDARSGDWQMFPGQGVLLREHDTIWLSPASPAELALIDMVNRQGEKGWSIQPAFLEQIQRQQQYIRVLWEGEPLQAQPVLNRKLYVRITRETDGALMVIVSIRPSPFLQLAPGMGDEDVLGFLGIEPRLFHRHIEREKDQLREFIRLTGLSADHKSSVWRITDVAGQLAFLDKLQTLPMKDLLVVEFARDQMKDLQIVAPRQMMMQMDVETTPGNGWLQVDGKARGDDCELSIRVLMAAWKAKKDYVQLHDGRWLKITAAIRDQLRQLCRSVVVDANGTLRLYPGAMEQVLQDAQSPLASALARQPQYQQGVSTAPAMVPQELNAQLRPYQQAGYQWLMRHAQRGQGACLADDMGLGKTLQTIAALLAESEQGPSLVVAPTSVLGNWQRELHKFAPSLRVKNIHDERDLATALREAQAGEVWLVSYGMLWRRESDLQRVTWNHIVFDEAQNLKNPTSRTHQSAKQLSGRWRLALTGTPIENRVLDLWSIFAVVAPNVLPEQETFKHLFLKPEQDALADSGVLLQQLVHPFVLRRLKEDLLTELPPKTEINMTVVLTDAERDLYESARRAALTHIREILQDEEAPSSKATHILAELTRLRQLACDPALILQEWQEASAKTTLFLDLSRQLLAGHHRALVFSQFSSYLRQLHDLLVDEGFQCFYLDGKTPRAEREKQVTNFQNGEGEFFFISLKAGGVGLNLTAADYVIHTDPWWNPKVEDQATDRAHRMGQERPVTVYRLISQDTIEEKILQLHTRKRALIDQVLSKNGDVSLEHDNIVEHWQELFGALSP